MTAINFPASPSPGDKWPTTGNIDGKVWAWDGTTWKIVSTNGTVTIIDNTARSFAFTVTYTNVPGSYNVVGTDRNGEVDGLNPTITVNEEDTLIFNVNASGHPFYLVWQHGGSSNQVGGGQGTNTASNQGTVNGTVTWVTDVGDGDALPTGELFYYQCGTHPAMYGTIKVLLKNTSDSASHIHDLIDLDDTPNAYDDGKYLRSTVTGTEWATVSGGSGTPGGSDTQVQFNDSGSFEGDASLVWDNTNNKLKIGTADSDSYLTVGNNSKRAELRNNSNSTYLYSYADSTFHIAAAGTGTTIQLDGVSGTMARFKKLAECALYYNGLEKFLTTDDGIKINGGIQDKDGELGTSGQILSSTGTQLDWIDAPGVFQGTVSGLVPASSSGTTDKFLRSDGTWHLVSSGGGADGNDYVTGAALGTGACLLYTSDAADE